MDIYRLYLNSESKDGGSRNSAIFNTYLPVKRNNYTNYKLYVDDFNISLATLTEDSICVKLDTAQYNSFNARTKGVNTTILTAFPQSKTGARTDDLCINYQAPNSPYNITSIPHEIKVTITDVFDSDITLDVDNFWILNLRIEAYYEEE